MPEAQESPRECWALSMSPREPSCYFSYFISNPRGTEAFIPNRIVASYLDPVHFHSVPLRHFFFRISVPFLVIQKDQRRAGVKEKDLRAPPQGVLVWTTSWPFYSLSGSIAAASPTARGPQNLCPVLLLDFLPAEWVACTMTGFAVLHL